MLSKNSHGVQWLEFELLAEFKGLVHGCLLRHGGHSEAAFSSLNLSSHVGDNQEKVVSNRQKIAKTLMLPQLVFSNQCHGKEIGTVNTNMECSLPRCDALTTQKTDVGLVITQADCQAAIFYDPIQKAIANVHSGWRGSTQNIYASVVDKMRQLYDSKPENLIVCISPSLGPQSAEFIHYEQELPKTFWNFKIGQNHFNFWEISRWQLEESGVLPAHIQIANIDTYTNPQDYFSYRYSKTCGRQATFCAIRESSKTKD